ncbi:MAG: histidine phosphatase family protein, partial [Holosporales bacterium]|nr:histidine phosphatase family protein [Holosporales bacterium]
MYITLKDEDLMHQHHPTLTYLKRTIIVLSCIFSFSLAQGMRRSPLCGLTPYDDGGTESRFVPMGAVVSDALLPSLLAILFRQSGDMPLFPLTRATSASPTALFPMHHVDEGKKRFVGSLVPLFLRGEISLPGVLFFVQNPTALSCLIGLAQQSLAAFSCLVRLTQQNPTIFPDADRELLHLLPTHALHDFPIAFPTISCAEKKKRSVKPSSFPLEFELQRQEAPGCDRLRAPSFFALKKRSVKSSSFPLEFELQRQEAPGCDLSKGQAVFIVRHGPTFGDDFIKGRCDGVLQIFKDGSFLEKILLNFENPQDIELYLNAARSGSPVSDVPPGHLLPGFPIGVFSLSLTLDDSPPSDSLAWMLVRKLRERHVSLCDSLTGEELTVKVVPFALTPDGFKSVSDTARGILPFLTGEGCFSVEVFTSPRYRTRQTAVCFADVFAKGGVKTEIVVESSLDDVPLRFAGDNKREVMQFYHDQEWLHQYDPERFLTGEDSWKFFEIVPIPGKTARKVLGAGVRRFFKERLHGSKRRVVILVTHDIPGTFLTAKLGGNEPIGLGRCSMVFLPNPVLSFHNKTGIQRRIRKEQ